MSLADFEIVTTTHGAISIRNIRVNEIMHNPIGPWKEANALYVDQSGLRKLLTNGNSRPLVLYDVGLGAASNAIASIQAALSLQTEHRKLHVVSFENNLTLLEFAILHAHEFEHMTGLESALNAILRDHRWESHCGRILWELRAGNFIELIERETTQAELIFFDPYSPSVNDEMWTFSCFEKLRKRCAPVESSDVTTLYTYSIATPIRSAMLLAGFFVGYGLSTGLKKETTQASTKFDVLTEPLGDRWYLRWQRSHKQLPTDIGENSAAASRDRIVSHKQFEKIAAVVEGQ